MEDALKALGKKIYTARKAKKMSRAELGKLTGLHETTVKRYEDGDIKSPNEEKLAAFAEVLNLNYEYLADWWIPEEYELNSKAELIAKKMTEVLYPDNPDTFTVGIMDLNDENAEAWKDLFNGFRALNADGKAKVLDYLADLTGHPNYQSDSSSPNRFLFYQVKETVTTLFSREQKDTQAKTETES